jgi:hyperosmotically inducible protein
MKRIFHFIIVVLAALTWPALAQDVTAPRTDDPGTSEADNTAQNVRERNEQPMTPLNQGNRQNDVNITAQIRKEIMAAPDLSMNAKNVKIVTQNGLVTLRGPVETAEEKNLIGEIANRIARPENVNNQLDVKGPSGSY